VSIVNLSTRQSDGAYAAPTMGGWRPQTFLGVLMTTYVALLPVQIETARFNIAPSDAVLVIALLVAGSQLRVLRGGFSGWHLALAVLFAFNAVMTVALRGSITEWALLNKVAGLGLLLLGYIAISGYARRWEQIRWLLDTFVVSVVVINAFSIVAFLAEMEVPIVNISDGRLSGMLIDPNAYGGLLVAALPCM